MCMRMCNSHLRKKKKEEYLCVDVVPGEAEG